MTQHVFIAGYPGDCGGASTECWSLIRLFRNNGLDVTLLNTWGEVKPEWREKTEAIGCETIELMPEGIGDVGGLPGSIVVSLCNTRFLNEAHTFRALGCRIVWAECMVWLFPQTQKHCKRYGLFDRHVFQSRYQADQHLPQLRRFGEPVTAVIPGAFDPADFPLRPLAHEPGEAFVIGRLSRRGVDKFPPDLWNQYERINHPIQIRVMGWSDEVENKCGPPPPWAEVLPERAETAQDFLAQCHCLMPGFDCCKENWPRVGLEAMSAGVPLVVQNRAGWKEMISEGSGDLCDTADEMAYRVAALAYDESLRMDRIGTARWHVECELSDPVAIWGAWKELFRGLTHD